MKLYYGSSLEDWVAFGLSGTTIHRDQIANLIRYTLTVLRKGAMTKVIKYGDMSNTKVINTKVMLNGARQITEFHQIAKTVEVQNTTWSFTTGEANG